REQSSIDREPDATPTKAVHRIVQFLRPGARGAIAVVIDAPCVLDAILNQDRRDHAMQPAQPIYLLTRLERLVWHVMDATTTMMPVVGVLIGVVLWPDGSGAKREIHETRMRGYEGITQCFHQVERRIGRLLRAMIHVYEDSNSRQLLQQDAALLGQASDIHMAAGHPRPVVRPETQPVAEDLPKILR